MLAPGFVFIVDRRIVLECGQAMMQPPILKGADVSGERVSLDLHPCVVLVQNIGILVDTHHALICNQAGISSKIDVVAAIVSGKLL